MPISDKILGELTSEVELFIGTLRTPERVAVVANFYKSKVSVGHEVNPRAADWTITSAGPDSPIENVVRRLIPESM